MANLILNGKSAPKVLGSREQGAGSREQGAGSREEGRRRKFSFNYYSNSAENSVNLNKKIALGWDLFEFLKKIELIIFLSVTIYPKLNPFTLL
ncbi:MULTISPECIES: hypothetical protein [unclassified Moorena]|uniref:hypothetical protein n=1 Tax=unclassified Moorena TaxID=2683338 RepID=UPI0014017F1E|nr:MULTISPECIES: hypothetical protein [unclassified Moorena]NEO17735.1 hypothetical protein [Moorena sp. SIO3E8]NEQ04284.1 hypothetical protein [Moorena sp. SIO3F7]